MAYLGNSPVPGNTVLQLEVRKSFSFALRFVDANDNPLDITGCTITLVVKEAERDTGDANDTDNLVVNSVAELVLAYRGFARFDLQATDLDHPAGEYPYAIVLRTPSGYSTVAVKGILELLPNTEFGSLAHDYDAANTPLSLEVAMRGETVIAVRIGSTLPPGMNYFTDAERVQLETRSVPDGGLIGQVLAKASGANGDTKWVNGGGGSGGGLVPEGVAAGKVPMADGANSWSWVALPSAATQHMEASVNLNTMQTTGSYVWSSMEHGTILNNFPVADNGGMLEVYATQDKLRVYQRFTTRDSLRVFTRSYRVPAGGGVWSAWLEVSQVGHQHAAADITSGTLNKDRVPRVTALNGISYGTAAAPTGQPDGTIYIKYTA